ncbi:MAG: hypothetical protein HKN83_11275 [Gammaproteobacteria bacterium]|nr:hypothetical protein [Gammaproteobacteria bacterium]
MTDWKNYLATAELASQKLNHDQIATVAKLLGLQIGAYRLRYGDEELEGFEEHIGVDDLSEKGQLVFIKGMESLMSLIGEIDIDSAEKH